MTTTTKINKVGHFFNMTPHPIVFGEIQLDEHGLQVFVALHTFENKSLIRLSCATELVGEIQLIDEHEDAPRVIITKTIFGEPVGLPPFNNGIYYIVSQLVKNALPERKDLVVPAEVYRDSKGNILGCLSFGI